MTVIFQVENVRELEEISDWLAGRKIVIQKVVPRKIDANAFLKRLRLYQVNLPEGYKFNRDEANER